KPGHLLRSGWRAEGEDKLIELKEINMDKQDNTNTITVTDENFDKEVLQSDVPVLVDFWAEWCGPCKIVGPTIDALASDYEGKVKVAKLNVDSSPKTAGRFSVRSIPTLMVFKDGAVQETTVGVRPKRQLAELIDQYLH
ncbi:MAG: thioredoxin, partial [Gammaproteobacteria bacterium]